MKIIFLSLQMRKKMSSRKTSEETLRNYSINLRKENKNLMKFFDLKPDGDIRFA